MGDGILLDTCAAIWLANGDGLSPDARLAIDRAGRRTEIGLSIVTAWEIGLLSRRPRKQGVPHPFSSDPKAWFSTFAAKPGLRVLALTAEIAIATSHLPGRFHADPADRMLVATARHLAIPIVTRDRKIIEYAEQGHVGVIVC